MNYIPKLKIEKEMIPFYAFIQMSNIYNIEYRN